MSHRHPDFARRRCAAYRRAASIAKALLAFVWVAWCPGAAPAQESGGVAAEPKEELLWPDGPKDVPPSLYPEPEKIVDRAAKGSETRDRVASNVSQPTITIFRAPKERATGTAAVIYPGGGYRTVGLDFGHTVARRLNAMGVTAAFVKYRTLPLDSDGKILEDLQRMAFQGTLADGQQAVRTLRTRAAELGVDPHRIGVMGFSAGGNLALSNMLKALDDKAKPKDKADAASSRPDFACLLYPGIDDWMPAQVKKGLCPTFIVTAADDDLLNTRMAVALFSAMQRAGVPVELHVPEFGGHGFGLGRTNVTRLWPHLFEAWLFDNGLVAH
jgi:acetyl esterase/lipase